MRDTVKTEEYFRERFNKDAEKLKRQLHHNNPDKYFVYIDAFLKFNSGYSLGLGMNELLPEVDLIIRNLIDTTKEMDSGYDDMAHFC